jgi:hypothetical protein
VVRLDDEWNHEIFWGKSGNEERSEMKKYSTIKIRIHLLFMWADNREHQDDKKHQELVWEMLLFSLLK